MPQTNILILDYKPLSNAGNLRAVVKIQIGSAIIHDYRLVHVSGQSPFVQPPQKQFLKDGKLCFAGPVIEFPEDTAATISERILERYSEDVPQNAS